MSEKQGSLKKLKFYCEKKIDIADDMKMTALNRGDERGRDTFFGEEIAYLDIKLAIEALMEEL